MKNKFKSLPKAVRVFLRIAVIIFVIVLLLSIAGPYFVLAIARQPEPAKDFYYSESFYPFFIQNQQKMRFDLKRSYI